MDYVNLSNIFIYVIIRPLGIEREDENFERRGWIMHSEIFEQLRSPRLVRVGLIQHRIVLNTSDPILDQRDAIHKKIESYIVQAASCDVNILCLQEAWSM